MAAGWFPFKEVEMRNLVRVLAATVAILACGAFAANAQAPGAQAPGTEPSPTAQPTAPVLPQQDQDSDQRGYYPHPGGMMGMMGGHSPGMMGMIGAGMMGRGAGYHDWCRGRDSAAPVMMRMIFSLMDADGDGKLTLQEFQAAHERIFKAMDTDHDGTVTLEEMQAFIRGH
jgi:EF-hand domain pair